MTATTSAADVDPGHQIDAWTIRASADRLTRQSLIAIVSDEDVNLDHGVTVHDLRTAGVTERDLATLITAP